MWRTACAVAERTSMRESKLLGASAILRKLSLTHSLPISLILSILQHFLEFTNSGGGNAEAFMSDTSTRSSLSVTVIFPHYVPSELHQSTPEYFLVVDSGATVHVVWDTTLCVFIREENRDIQWGHGRSVCTNISHLCGTTFMLVNNSKWSKVILTSGSDDTWVVPMSGRQLFSQIRAKQQGHRCFLDGPKPGLLVRGDENQFIPFVEDGDKGYCLFPMHPPPSPIARHADLTASSMRVVNLNQHSEFAAPAHAMKGIKVKLSKAQRFLTERAAFRKRRGEALLRAKELKAKEEANLRLMRQQMQKARHRSDFVYMHRKCGHSYMKRLCKFKRTGKVIASRLPPKFLREYRDECPICLAMKKKRKPLPKVSNHSLSHLAPWEEIQVDSSGKFRVESKQGNRYFTNFVCAKTGDKIVIAHAKKKHFPLVYMKFVRRIGRHPRVMYSDYAGEITGKQFQLYLETKGVTHIVVPKGEHHSIGIAEKGIQDLSVMLRCFLADSNIPRAYWDYVIEHCALVLNMISPSICDPNITIHEAVHGVIPNLDLIPVVGCFAARLEEKSWRTDYKLDPSNQSGVFLGYATQKNVYGAQILTDKSVITARHQVAFDENLLPFLEKDNSNSRMKHLQWLLGRKGQPPSISNDDLSCESGHTSKNALYLPDDDEQSSDDDEVTTLMQDIETLSKHPPFSILEPQPKRTHALHPRLTKKKQRQAKEAESEGGTASIRRSSRARKRSVDVSPQPDNVQSGKKVQKSRRGANVHSSRIKKTFSPVTPDDLRINKTLLIGRTLQRHFPGYGGAKGLVTKYILDKDVYEIEYADGHVEHLQFEDALTLIPKSWAKGQSQPNVHEVLLASVENAALNAHIANSSSSTAKNGKYTTPKDFATAIDPLVTPDYREWREATTSEYNLLNKEMKCWEEMDMKDLPPDANLLGTKWVLKLKFQNGEYERHKARIVALGYLQRPGKDFHASFSPTASYVTIRMILALTALLYWYSYDLDATGAFISSPLPPEEQVYLKPIEGFPLGPNKCLKLKKTIYGLVQAPLAFFKLCKEVYTKCGLTQLKSDECVFYRYVQNIKGQPDLKLENILESGGFQTMPIVPPEQRVYQSCHYPVACIIITLYVDNNGVRLNCKELLDEFLAEVAKDGRIDLHITGDMSAFLSVRYLCDPLTGEIRADQEPFIDGIVDRWVGQNANTNKVPLHPKVDLSKIPLPAVPDTYLTGLYAQLIGELVFVGINTQPAIMQAVNALSRYMTNATEEHMTHAKGVVRYLKGNKKRQIIWSAASVKEPFRPCEFYAFADSSWADVVPSRKSTYCYLIFVNGAVFSWKSAVASVLAMSSTEAELIALCACAADVAYCRKVANELGFHQWRPTVIHEDNEGAKQLAESGNFRGRSKHFDLRWKFLVDYCRRGIVTIKAVKRLLQLADIGASARAYPQLEAACKCIYGEQWLATV